MTSVIAMRVLRGRSKKSFEDLREDEMRPFASVEEVRSELLPLLPAGTRWPEGSDTAEWNAPSAEWPDATWWTINVELPNTVTLTTSGIAGDVLALLRRLHDTDRWVVITMEPTAVFDPDNPFGE